MWDISFYRAFRELVYEDSDSALSQRNKHTNRLLSLIPQYSPYTTLRKQRFVNGGIGDGARRSLGVIVGGASHDALFGFIKCTSFVCLGVSLPKTPLFWLDCMPPDCGVVNPI